MRLNGKKIIVTAAAQGIGRATAIKFVNEGATVIATDINEEKLQELKKEVADIQIYKLDATNKNEVEKVSDTISSIEIKRLSKFAEWKGNDLLFNALIFDDAQTKEDFLSFL